MNAGAMGGEIFDLVESVRYLTLDGAVMVRERAEIETSYRQCELLRSAVAVSAILAGRPDDAERIAARMKAGNEKRWSSQPAAMSAGCIFKNHPRSPAGKLVDELGLKGARVGDAVVSEAHGNFIVNRGGAKAKDVLALIERVRTRALAERGIALETEVQIIGEDCSLPKERVKSLLWRAGRRMSEAYP